MSESDLKINSKVRKILTEYNVDLSQVSISATSGTVSIRGEFRKLSGHDIRDNEIPKFLAVLESVILRTKGVKRVNFTIKNWIKTKGKWGREEDDKEQ